MKKKVKLTESKLYSIIKECVKRVINEDAKFDSYFERELQMPYEMRRSRMTDEEILGLLKKHKKRDMEYDFQQAQENGLKNTYSTDNLENKNVRDHSWVFNGRDAFIRGDY